LSKAGLSDQEIEQFVIPQRTRRHRAEKKQPLTVEESDRAVRLLRVQTLAEGTFGDVVKANAWLRGPLAELHGESHEISEEEHGPALRAEGYSIATAQLEANKTQVFKLVERLVEVGRVDAAEFLQLMNEKA
jgi:hypothetical protein